MYKNNRNNETNNARVNIVFRDEVSKLNALVKKGNGITYVSCTEFPNILAILEAKTNYKIFFRTEDGYIIGTTARIKNIILKVPQEIAGIVVGKEGRRIKAIQKRLGASHIEIGTL